MASFRLSLLGEPVLHGPAGSARIGTRKGQALLWYLAAHPDRTFSRPHVAALLWEDAGEAQARHSLTSTLNRLRSALPVWPLVTEKETIGWDRAAGVLLDLDCVHSAAAAVAPAPAQLAAATDLWRGPFLDGFHLPHNEAYNEWLRRERQAWEDRVLELFTRLATAEEAAGDWQSLVTHARRALTINPVQERFHRWLMLALYQAGERSAALAQYDACLLLLRAEVDALPDPDTVALRDAIAAGDLQRWQPPPGSARRQPAPESAARPLTTALPFPPLVGRDAELANTEAALARAAAGQGRAVLLYGEAGVGKTRLITELTWRARQPGPAVPTWRTILAGHCYAETRDLPFAPLAEALTGLLPHLDPADLPLDPNWLAEVARLVPSLRHWRPDLPAPPPQDPAREKLRLFDGITRFLDALPGPVLLLVEDLHWADEGTVQFLSYLSRRDLAPPAALLLSARTGDLTLAGEQILRQLQREGRLEWITLDRLSREATHGLTVALNGWTDRVFSGRLHALTQGNPLFAVELLRSLQEDAGVSSPDAAALDRQEVPATVQAVVHGRLERLSPPDRALLAAAALFPGPAPFAVLPAVIGLDSEAAHAALEALVRSGFVHETGADHAPAVGFGHDLVRGVVAGGLTRSRRSALHRRIYRSLAQAAAASDQQPSWFEAEHLAYHAAAGGLWAEGLQWNLRGAESSQRQSLFATSVRCLEQALSCLERLQPTPDRRRQGIDLRLELAYLISHLQPDRVPEWLNPALAAARDLGDTARLTRGQMAEATFLLWSGRPRETVALAEQLLPTARTLGDPRLLTGAILVLGRSLVLAAAELERAEPLLDEAIGLLTQEGDLLDAIHTRVLLATTLALRGEFRRSEAVVADLVATTLAQQDPALAIYGYATAALQEAIRGDWAAAMTAAAKADSLAHQSEFVFQEHIANFCLGIALAHRGDLEGAIAAQRRVLDLSEQSAMPIWLGLSQAWMGEILLLAGRSDEAEQEALAAERFARERGSPIDVAFAAKIRGAVAAAAGRSAEAHSYLTAAQEQFMAIGMRPEVARCHALLAGVAEHEDQRVLHRQKARALFRHLGMRWDLRQLG